MKNLIKYTQNTNALYHLWHSGDVLIIGVSGGPDSMCLLDVMVHIAQKEHLSLIVAHVNYGLRGNDSLDDQKLVQNTAKKHNLVCEILEYKGDLSGGEALFRDIRYTFFAQLKEKYRAYATVVGHTKNDQAETMLLHLLRGSGLRGMGGMRMKSSQDIIRPFLRIRREDIVAYCDAHNVRFHIDKTNKNIIYTRNCVRNELLPLLEKKYNPHIIDTLADTATLIADDYNALTEYLVPFWHINDTKKSLIFDRDVFLAQHIALQRLALRSMIIQLCGHVVNIEKGFIEELRHALTCDKNKPQKICGKDLKMQRKGGKVKLTYR